MKVNSDTAHKKLKNIQEQINRIIQLERQNRTYAHAPGEEPIINPYDFYKTQEQLADLHAAVRHIKHAISLFNQTTTIGIETVSYPDKNAKDKDKEIKTTTMTIDEALSYMQWLNSRKAILGEMLRIPKTERCNNYNGKAPDIIHRNFDITEVEQCYTSICETLINTQQAINTANLMITFEI